MMASKRMKLNPRLGDALMPNCNTTNGSIGVLRADRDDSLCGEYSDVQTPYETYTNFVEV